MQITPNLHAIRNELELHEFFKLNLSGRYSPLKKNWQSDLPLWEISADMLTAYLKKLEKI